MSLRERLYSLYRFFQRRITPGLQFSQYIYQQVLEAQVSPGSRWLDVGCGHQLLPPWRLQEERELVARPQRIIGLDPHFPSLLNHRTIALRVNADVARLPFADESFDLVTANMVVEHLADPASQFREIARVLKAGGSFVFHTPNRSGYLTQLAELIPEAIKPRLAYLLQGRKPEDVFPTHYRANDEAQIRQLANACGFEVRAVKMLVSSANLAMVFPLFLVELAWIRMLMRSSLRARRPYLIATLQKSAGARSAATPSLAETRR